MRVTIPVYRNGALIGDWYVHRQGRALVTLSTGEGTMGFSELTFSRVTGRCLESDALTIKPDRALRRPVKRPATRKTRKPTGKQRGFGFE